MISTIVAEQLPNQLTRIQSSLPAKAPKTTRPSRRSSVTSGDESAPTTVKERTKWLENHVKSLEAKVNTIHHSPQTPSTARNETDLLINPITIETSQVPPLQHIFPDHLTSNITDPNDLYSQ